MIRIAVCEDELIFRDCISKAMNCIFSKSSLPYEILEFSTERDFLKAVLENGIFFDVILMDVTLEDGDGFQLIKDLRERGLSSKVIFVTAQEDIAFSAFSLSVYDFIRKTQLLDELKRVGERLLASYTSEIRIKEWIDDYHRDRLIDIKDIAYVDVIDRRVCFHLDSGENVSTVIRSLNDIPPITSNTIIQVSKGLVVNLDKIQDYQVNTGQIVFNNQDNATVPRRSAKNFYNLYMEHRNRDF